ncbi:hypothetical protein MJA45_15865 [Paenibacillus aurantius]|uniref:DUF2269 domain-containing protein n=1 Tax=Paenibacillus aurantius TaxID=2918900 RepID=A0AA96L9B8_9BACL|nr:hypothetical protein [Paenibacillus aurantius]WNQ09123.1 hypothetical protein MJA45_15865 [Paenibacillus aurantius]
MDTTLFSCFFQTRREVVPLYRLLVFLHVVSVLVSVGPFFILIPLIRKLRQADEKELNYYLPTFAGSVRLSKHAGHVLVVSGILLMWLGEWSWGTSWVVLTIVVMVSSLYFIARAFSPTLRKLQQPHENRDALVNKLRFSLALYIVLMLVMLWFMVVKPQLW